MSTQEEVVQAIQTLQAQVAVLHAERQEKIFDDKKMLSIGRLVHVFCAEIWSDAPQSPFRNNFVDRAFETSKLSLSN